MSTGGGEAGLASTSKQETHGREKIWDMFQTVPVDGEQKGKRVSAWQIVYQICKVILYGALTLAVLGGLLSSRWALIVMTGQIGKYQQLMNADSSEQLSAQSAKLHRDGWVYWLMFGVIFPYVWTFLEGLVKMKWNHQSLPSIRCVALMIVTQALHSVGLSILLWKVLPVMDVLEACTVFSAVGVIPSFLYIFHIQEMKREVKHVAFSVGAFLFQAAGLGLFVWQSIIRNGLSWELPVSITLISFNYIKSYLTLTNESDLWLEQQLSGCFSRKSCECSKSCNCRKECKCPRKCRCTCTCTCKLSEQEKQLHLQNYILPSLLKIGLTIGLAFAWVEGGLSAPDVALKTLTGNTAEWSTPTLYAVLVTFIAAPALTFFFAYKASQLMMQKICYAAPVALHTLLVGVLTWSFANLTPKLIQFQLLLPPPTASFPHYILLASSLCWLSQLWISKHLWQPTNKILEHRQKLFVSPIYCSINLEQFLSYCRAITQTRLQFLSCCRKATYEERDNQREGSEENGNSGSKIIPMIYLCATLWQENKEEMLQMLKSILRLDEDHAKIANYNKLITSCGGDKGKMHKEKYNFEVHVMFDNVMAKNESRLNDYVYSFLETTKEAISCLEYEEIPKSLPVKKFTPYGVQMIYTLPGGNKMFVHLKDKKKIRIKKRWSQIMYMYYLLGFKTLSDAELIDHPQIMCNQHQSTAEAFHKLDKPAVTKSKNTYLLALDGDVEWKVEDLQMLVHRLEKDETVGVACGRIHPIGSGPMVWYQKFEYAIGHWLQKTTEHVLGCVLCAPGCFSLFRGSAIMDDNVMKTYSTKATEARHYVQYDQGEDRWLCTLLLQRGYRVEYVAASDAYTFAPGTFEEFFKQRRRWTPSTMANILDLLGSWLHLVKCNSSISHLFMLYQLLIFISATLGPGTIVLLIADVFNEVWQVGLGWSLILSLTPAVLYLVVCFIAKETVQIVMAAILSAFYSIMMMSVIVSSFVTMADWRLTTTELFLILTGGIFIITAILHPREIYSLLHGVLYYITIPSGYLVLIIFALANLNVTSWGTRDAGAAENSPEKKKGPCDRLAAFFMKCFGWSERETEENQEKKNKAEETSANNEKERNDKSTNAQCENIRTFETCEEKELDPEEETFWEDVIEKYLKPCEAYGVKDEEKTNLKRLRNNVCFAFFMLNALWIATNFFLQVKLPDLKPTPEPNSTITTTTMAPIKVLGFKIEYDLLHLVFLVFFGTTLIIQFLAMLSHRVATFGHIMANTKIRKFCNTEEKVMNLVCDIMRQPPAIGQLQNDQEASDQSQAVSRNPAWLLTRFDENLQRVRTENEVWCKCLKDRVEQLTKSLDSDGCKFCTWKRHQHAREERADSNV